MDNSMHEKIEYQNSIQDKRISVLETAVQEVLTNHLPHIQIAQTKTAEDVSWLKRFFWILITASTVSAIAAIFNLILRFTQK